MRYSELLDSVSYFDFKLGKLWHLRRKNLHEMHHVQTHPSPHPSATIFVGFVVKVIRKTNSITPKYVISDNYNNFSEYILMSGPSLFAQHQYFRI